MPKRSKGDGSVFKRAGRKGWYYKVPGGNPVRAHGSKADALRALAKAVHLAKALNGTTSNVRAADFIEAYSDLHEKRVSAATMKRDAGRLALAATWMREEARNPSMHAVTEATARDYLDDLLTTRSVATARLFRSNLSQAWKEAIRRGIVTHNVWKAVSLPKPRQLAVPFMTHEDLVARVYDAVEPAEHRSLVITLGETGMRRGEALRLRWRDLDFRRKVVLIEESKNGTPRVVGLNPYVLAELKRHKKTQPVDAHGNVFSMSEHQVRNRWDHARERGGFTLRMHDLRHIFASRLAFSGEPMQVIARILGHSIAMAQRYSCHAPKDAAVAAVQRLARFESSSAEGSPTRSEQSR